MTEKEKEEERNYLMVTLGLKPSNGSMYCCGCLVQEGQRCPVCGDLNYPI